MESQCGLAQWFRPHIRVDSQTVMASHDKYFSRRFLMQNNFFSQKNDQVTPELNLILQQCPRPRLTSFDGGNVHFPLNRRHEVLQHIAYDAQSDGVMYWNQLAYEDEGMRFAVD